FDKKLAVFEHDNCRLRAEEVGRQLGRLGHDLVDALDDGSAADHGGTTAVGIASVVGDRGVATHDHDVFDGYTKSIGGDLGEAGFLALPVRRGAGDDGDLARHFDADTAPFPAAGRHHFGRAERADFDVGAQADSEDSAGAPGGVALLEQL